MGQSREDIRSTDGAGERPRCASSSSGFFDSYASATLLLSSVAGLLAIGSRGTFWPFLVGPVLCLIPGVVQRSWDKMKLAALLGFLAPAIVAGLLGQFLCLGRYESVPLTAYEIPFVGVFGYVHRPLGPGSRAFLVLCAYLLPADVIVLAMRERPLPWRRETAGLVGSYIAALLVYRVSWFATVQGPSYVPQTHVWVELLAMACYALLYPVKYMLMHYLADPTGFFRPSSAGSARAGT